MAYMFFRDVPAALTTGTSIKTLIQILAATNVCVKIGEVSISFNGVSNTAAPIYVEMVKQTSAGTITNTTTVVKEDASRAETIQLVAKDTATIEPTDSAAVTLAEYVHPQTGFLWQAPYLREQIIVGAGRLGLRVTAAASVSAGCRLIGEERWRVPATANRLGEEVRYGADRLRPVRFASPEESPWPI